MSEEEYVRPADAARHECLLPTSPTTRGFIPYSERDEDECYRRILSESEFEYEMEQILAESLLEEGRRRAREERARRFATLKTKFLQFKRLDKANQEFYVSLVAYIDSYESGDLIQARVGGEFYGKFRRILNNIRISAEDKRRILGFIVPDETDEGEWSDTSSISDV
ncbi:hypothetical protein EB093_07575 [bacterium]|nr:hypothetical protein [bacterium]